MFYISMRPSSSYPSFPSGEKLISGLNHVLPDPWCRPSPRKVSDLNFHSCRSSFFPSSFKPQDSLCPRTPFFKTWSGPELVLPFLTSPSLLLFFQNMSFLPLVQGVRIPLSVVSSPPLLDCRSCRRFLTLSSPFSENLLFSWYCSRFLQSFRSSRGRSFVRIRVIFFCRVSSLLYPLESVGRVISIDVLSFVSLKRHRDSLPTPPNQKTQKYLLSVCIRSFIWSGFCSH